MTVTTDTSFDPEAQTSNVIANTPGGDATKTIVVGAHLDSVDGGAGINDNGSGTATILEIAEEMAEAGVKPRQKVRFAFWGAEESGLLGSEHYVDSLSDTALSRIVANLNFDMVGSPNYVRFVYDGDGSDTDPAGPPGSGQIERMFTNYFDSQGLDSAPTEFSGRSDYGPFIAVGIPAGGLFTGAEGVKTAEEAAIFGGTAGEAYDPCYHQACDDMTNLSTKALSEMGDAAAHAIFRLAVTKNGLLRGRQLPQAGSSARSDDELRQPREPRGSLITRTTSTTARPAGAVPSREGAAPAARPGQRRAAVRGGGAGGAGGRSRCGPPG